MLSLRHLRLMRPAFATPIGFGRGQASGRSPIHARSAQFADKGSILRSLMGRRAWRQWRAVARFFLSQFFGNLPQGTKQSWLRQRIRFP
jgi:hypothetical protein